ncbi:Zn(2)-C6 fungal-type DNA-binding domain protein [Akanthomyces lecanii RCEF 1005]|uniref:Zn(2)-C6 fungal-type DNA-binding domain protein n=1 Tax=Akanthomyces lecanii RCEF 1005 TaxID=1081108 RepID=A0A168BZW6_CORDF|nr:Zn(2)-C6 fungal-type DNA-binding domain protein [Akanthomyces lecanii RCEF 1005]
MNRSANSRSRAGKRNATACEHCRAAKARCQPSEQPGVCQKCFVARRECISRTKARPHRARSSPTLEEAKFKSQHSTQPATFTIATFLPARSHRDEVYEDLREIHRHTFTNALDDEDSAQETPNLSHSTATPSVTSTTARAAADIWRKPRFNTASAQELLKTFVSISENLPFVKLPNECTVPQLAATQPFVLLAILTVTSGSGSVQKHSLYDDEFLKILGLKYVSGGDGSLELLRGLLIYCAWYPFHLKPKNSQLARCMRMAAGIVHDLNLDDDFLAFQPWEQGVRADDLDKIRTYLAYVYLVSTYIVVWKGDRFVSTRQPPWTTTAIDILEQYAETDDDRKLAILARVSTLFAEAAGAVNGRDSAEVRSSQLILCPGVLDDVTIRLQIMYVELYLDVGSLLAFPVAKTALSAKRTRFAPPTAKINSSVKKLGAFLHLVAELGDADMLAFTVSDWTRLIIILTLAFRLSFPLALAPEFDWLSARKEIQLEQFLSEVSRGGGEAAASSGILAANRVVLGVLGSKYSQRERALAETAPFAAPPNRSAGCPVMGGRGGVTIAQWDLNLGDGPELSTDPDMPDMLPMLHNMWATGGIAWQDVDKILWDSFGDQVGGDANSWALQ